MWRFVICTEVQAVLILCLFTILKNHIKKSRIYKVIKFIVHQCEYLLYLRSSVYLPPVVDSRQKVFPLVRYKMLDTSCSIRKRIL